MFLVSFFNVLLSLILSGLFRLLLVCCVVFVTVGQEERASMFSSRSNSRFFFCFTFWKQQNESVCVSVCPVSHQGEPEASSVLC